MTPETAETFIATLLTGICLFCANLLLLRRRDPGVYLPLALLFLFQGISSLTYLLADAAGKMDQVGIWMRMGVLISTIEISIPFLFWLYVRGLTSEGEVQRVPKLHYHLIPIAVVALLAGSAVFLPPELDQPDLPDDHPALMRITLIVLAILLGNLLFMIMIATYLFLTIRRLKAYHTRLKDIFASTENRELTWIWAITIAAVIYLLGVMAILVVIGLEALNETEDYVLIGTLNSLTLLILFWVIGIWGLRQRPGLIRTPVTDPPEPPTPTSQKYEKSALDDERAARIARKIEAAMSNDMLYREPNLSLWDLAKHIGVTSHYVSQTLNTHLDSSFFDFVNRWRIRDAVEQLNTTDETILMIAYDVGFNSRSAFYKAFKRETGKTPSDLRK